MGAFHQHHPPCHIGPRAHDDLCAKDWCERPSVPRRRGAVPLCELHLAEWVDRCRLVRRRNNLHAC